MAVSIHDVAKRAGVSISTVSRILNGSANVSEKKAAAVQEALKYYHYEPNQFGRGLVKQKSNMVGVYFPSSVGFVFEASYHLELLKGIEKELSCQNYSMVLLCETENYEKHSSTVPKYLEYIRQKRIDGLLLSGLSDKGERDVVFQQILEEDYPVVYIGRRVHQRGLNVYAQFEVYNVQMLKLLWERGHKNILLYMYSVHFRYLELILQKAAELIPDLKIYPSVLDQNLYSRDRLLQDTQKCIIHERCTAVISPDIELTHQILGVCTELKLSVPDQVSIISVEHRKGSGQLCYPPISSFYIPAKDMGSGAVSLLLKRIHGTDDMRDASINYEATYIERGSIKCT